MAICSFRRGLSLTAIANRCTAGESLRHSASPFRLTPRVVRRLCVAAQRNPWAPRGRSRGPGDKRGAPARCLNIQERAEAAEAGPRRGRSRSANLLEHLYFAHIAYLYCSHPPHCVRVPIRKYVCSAMGVYRTSCLLVCRFINREFRKRFCSTYS